MDAREYFQGTVVPDYNAFVASPTNFRLLRHAILSMNTMPEYLGLDRRNYPPDVSRNQRRRDAQAIREDKDNNLTDLQTCADVLKHVRSNTDQGTLSSTGIDAKNQATWYINGKYLPNVAHDGFAKLSGLLNKPST
jgi:hypothetical protein